MSACLHCGKVLPEYVEEPWCPYCGIRFATKATPKKHEYLEDLCTANKYDVVVDACAGSGKVQYPDGKLGEGSPLILRRLTKGRCICIEYEQKTFNLLTTFVKDTELIHGDCNDYLLKYVDGKASTLVFIDPNGYGVPAIRHDIVSKIAKTKNTDVLVTFSWRICREMGYTATYLNCDMENCPSPSDISRKFGTCDECTNRIRALTWKQSLSTWWGHSEWLQWSNLGARGYVEKYASGLNNGNTIDITAFAGGGDRYYRNDFYLILATKFDLPKYGILKWVRPRN
jgi:three-Cys-motif partner protein